MNKKAKIYIAGHRGLVGSAIFRALSKKGYDNLVVRTSSELDLRNQAAVQEFFKVEKPEYVFLAAAKVGGIYANDTYPAEFISDNLQIQTNVIDKSYKNGVKRLLFLGSSCVYPKMSPQPMSESCLLTSELEPTNEWYAIAKISGIKMCQAYYKQYDFDAFSVMPTNLYGPNDNFDLETSHVLPALLRKFHLAKLALNGDYDSILKDEKRFGKIPDDIRSNLNIDNDAKPKVVLWGSGNPYREFLYVDDMAAACLYLMQTEVNLESSSRLFNVGFGSDLRIHELAELIQSIVGFEGEVIWDLSKPDGSPRKLLDVSLLRSLGWEASTALSTGVKSVYKTYSAYSK